MTETTGIFQAHYDAYLEKLRALDFNRIGPVLGGRLDAGTIEIPLFNRSYVIGDDGVVDAQGHRPPYAICVLLCRYLLMCPDSIPPAGDWVSYRDFKDSGPLTVYFANDVERAMIRRFAGRTAELRSACAALGARPAPVKTSHDVAARFDALPGTPLLLLFNDGDDEFPAACSVLFEQRAERFLDAESLAILGRDLFETLSGGG